MSGIQLHRRHLEALPVHEDPAIAWITVIINLGGVYAGVMCYLHPRVRCSSMPRACN